MFHELTKYGLNFGKNSGYRKRWDDIRTELKIREFIVKDVAIKEMIFNLKLEETIGIIH
jgi:hypothetical protein